MRTTEKAWVTNQEERNPTKNFITFLAIVLLIVVITAMKTSAQEIRTTPVMDSLRTQIKVKIVERNATRQCLTKAADEKSRKYWRDELKRENEDIYSTTLKLEYFAQTTNGAKKGKALQYNVNQDKFEYR